MTTVDGIAPARNRLPNRRGHETFDFEFMGLRYICSFGRFPNGTLSEIFLNAAKQGSTLDAAVHDDAITASLALQYGCPPDVLRKALTRNGNGSASGPLAQALDLIAGGQS